MTTLPAQSETNVSPGMKGVTLGRYGARVTQGGRGKTRGPLGWQTTVIPNSALGGFGPAGAVLTQMRRRRALSPALVNTAQIQATRDTPAPGEKRSTELGPGHRGR